MIFKTPTQMQPVMKLRLSRQIQRSKTRLTSANTKWREITNWPKTHDLGHPHTFFVNIPAILMQE